MDSDECIVTNTKDDYSISYNNQDLKRIVEAASVENGWVNNYDEYHINLEEARIKIKDFIYKITAELNNSIKYNSLFIDFIDYCLKIIVTDWGDYLGDLEHINNIQRFITVFTNIKGNTIIAYNHPFGNRLPLDVQKKILDINNIEEANKKKHIVNDIMIPLLEYVKKRYIWAWELMKLT